MVSEKTKDLYRILFHLCDKRDSGTLFIITMENKGCYITIENGKVISLSSGKQQGDHFIKEFKLLNLKSFSFKQDLMIPISEKSKITSSRLFLITLDYKTTKEHDLPIRNISEIRTPALNDTNTLKRKGYSIAASLAFLTLSIPTLIHDAHESNKMQKRFVQLDLIPQDYTTNTDQVVLANDSIIKQSKKLPPHRIQFELPEVVLFEKKIIQINHFPVKDGWISSLYGIRKDPFNGKRRMHSGIDIAARKGSSISPLGSGKVIFTGYKSGYGKTIEIQHGNTIVTRYSHLKKYMVKKGQSVSQTDVIAQVGNSGRSTGPHLHLEVLLDGEKVDPQLYLVERVAKR